VTSPVVRFAAGSRFLVRGELKWPIGGPLKPLTLR
jgi:hypothetical protein